MNTSLPAGREGKPVRDLMVAVALVLLLIVLTYLAWGASIDAAFLVLPPEIAMLSGDASTALLLLMAIGLLWWWFRTPARADLGSPTLAGAGAAIGVGIAGFVLLLVVGWLFPGFGFAGGQDFSGMAAYALHAAASLMFSVAAFPVLEELLFRGALWSMARRVMGAVPAALLVSACSAAFNVATAPSMFLFSLLLCALRARFGLVACIIAHVIYGALVFLLGLFPTDVTGGAFEFG